MIIKERGRIMKKSLTVSILVMAACSIVIFAYANDMKKGTMGEELFKEQCVMCHPDGGNIINLEKTLHKKELNEHKLTNADDIVALMRNPGPGMPSFDKEKIPDEFAEKIARYILDTFK
jgi:cytochrome c6